MNSNTNILWADDEIDILKPQILFLESKNYTVTPVTNGFDALEKVKSEYYDVIFLDEQMPGMSGLETLGAIKEIRPHVPIVLITKSEEENLMDEAIGSKISDYLIKPVNPRQIMLTLKRLLDNSRLVTEKSTMDYQKTFNKIAMQIMNADSIDSWMEIYKKLVYWELELQNNQDQNIADILIMQKQEANNEFSKFIKKNYLDILQDSYSESGPMMSHNLLKRLVLPNINDDKSVFFILIDNLRLDQWKLISGYLRDHIKLKDEGLFTSILPTTTQYSRNAIFSGMMPSEIAKKFPDMWINDEDEGSKNKYEEDFLKTFLDKTLSKPIKWSYHKVFNFDFSKHVNSKLHQLLNNDLNVIVYNFVDMLSHARTEDDIIKELANDEAAYRKVTESWFEHSPLYELIKTLKDKKAKVIFATDHGTIRVQSPIKVIGDRSTTSNLRYKHGRSLQFDPKEVLDTTEPEKFKLPSPNINSKYIFARSNDYMVYPNNYNHYVSYYKNTFQHGGISLEEMIIPFAIYNC